MFDSELIALIALAVVMVCMVCLLIRYVKAGQKSRVWFTAAATLLIVVAWIVQFIRYLR